MSSQLYFISRSPGKTEGPFSKEDLMAQELPTYTQVFTHENNEWRPLSSFPELSQPEKKVLIEGKPEGASAQNQTDEAKEKQSTSLNEAALEEAALEVTDELESDSTSSDFKTPFALDTWDVAEWKEATRRKRLAKIGLIACIAASLLSIAASFNAKDVLERIMFEDYYDSGEMLEAAEFSDSLEGFAALAYFVALVVSIIYFFRWFQYLYRNLYERVELPWSIASAAWSWFTPIIFYFRPYQIAGRMIDASAAKEGKGAVGIWWALWIGSTLVDQMGPGISEVWSDDATIPELIDQAQWSIASMSFKVFSALAALAAVKAISEAALTWPAKSDKAVSPG